MQTFSLGDPVDGMPTMIPYTTDGGAAVLKWVPENVTYWLARAFPVTRYADAAVEIERSQLVERDVDLVGPAVGALACGVGAGACCGSSGVGL